MRIFTITAGSHKGKHIHVTDYIKRDRGIDIKIGHNVPSTAGKELQWVQTVSDNGSFGRPCKLNPHVDPFGPPGSGNTVSLPAVPGLCQADDLLPFYWTAAELAAGRGPGLSDTPRESVPTSGRTWTQFVTALTEVTGMSVHHLVAIAWGYDLMADGTVRVAAIRTPTTAEMRAHGHAMKRMYPAYKYT
jgi:hypothetical protein